MKKISVTALSLLLTGCLFDSHFETPASAQKKHGSGLVQSSDLSRNGALSVIARQDDVCLWSNISDKKVFPCIAEGNIELTGIADNESVFYISYRLSVSLFSATSGKLLGAWTSGENIIRDIGISSDGETLLLGYRSGITEVINVRSNRRTQHTLHDLDVNTVALSADGRTAMTGSSDKFVKLWDVQTGKELQSYKFSTRVNHVSLNADATMAFVLDSVNARQFIDLKSQELSSSLSTYSNFIEFNQSAFINNDQWLLTASPNQKVQIWRVADGDLIAKFMANKVDGRDRASVLSIAMDESRQVVISETNDGVVETWPIKPLL
ncbi:hypothetical protein CWB99_21320 [Pseudoalteromonas rubra]|uniref:WD40 repeat domain-containing protein n=1 Tax=Pseudoalteromonas rubra TaxID=43658 RepID=A0A5S3WHA2_9GAMM|nr:hypothetical protein [Pseudoalteromonas rubra]TMP25133.1 hypothetical protein CWB99_21320 [Pseudoalteromonas rubra]TMP33965.1 hypothetical protein CWC00_08670 [Pseudoalteromonas rubra]